MEPLAKGVASVLVSYSVHYAASHLYTTTCVPHGLLGFFQGLLAVGSPLCKAAQTIADATSTSYASLLGVGVSRLLVDLTFTGIGGKTPRMTSASLEQVHLNPPPALHIG